MRHALFACALLAALPACGEPTTTEPPPPSVDPAHVELWSRCLRDSELAGVSRETIPGLELELGGVSVVTGALGQRGGDAEPPEKAVRLAAVGGALTFGTGLPAEQAWPQAMAAQLSRSILTNGRDVVALNLGTVFASVTDLLGIATQRAIGWRPHLLVVELDASRRDGASDEELAAALQALRAAAGGVECGVLVVVTTPLRAGPPDQAAEEQAAALLAAVDRAGLTPMDLRATFAGRPPEELLDAAGNDANAQAQGMVLEAVKQALFHSGALGRAANAR